MPRFILIIVCILVLGGHMDVNSISLEFEGYSSADSHIYSSHVIYEKQDQIFVDTRDGTTYKTVKIGRQIWMAENLNYNTSGSWCYGNNNDQCDIYGRLYTWMAAWNACPAGWHLPSDIEWKYLERYLGMSKAALDTTGYRGTDQGAQLKSTTGWNSGENGTNSSGFGGLPGGYRYLKGTFDGVGYSTDWWSSTEFDADNAWGRKLYYSGSYILRLGSNKSSGYSVRCIKDK